MGCIAATDSSTELSFGDREGKEDSDDTKSKHQSKLGTQEISVIAPESPIPKTTILSSLDTEILDYIGIQLRTKTKHSTDVKPRKTSLSSLKDILRGKSSRKSSKPKQPKYRTNEIYKSSPEHSEIQEQETSATNSIKKRLKNYKLSSCDTSVVDIDEDSSSYDFESITKLTTITNLACDINNSGNETVIENDTIITMSRINSHLSTSAMSQTSTNATSLKVNQTLLKPNVILPLPLTSLSRYKGIENPFYHSEDGADIDDDDIQSNSSYYNNYNWYQPFKQSKHFVPHSKGDKVKTGAIYPFLSRSKRSVASTYNSMRAQVSSSGDSHENQSRNYNPFRARSVYPPTVSTGIDDTVESDDHGSPPPYPHSEYYRYPPPPHTYNHYSQSDDTSNTSTHV